LAQSDLPARLLSLLSSLLSFQKLLLPGNIATTNDFA
jgi:hypothetical protein